MQLAGTRAGLATLATAAVVALGCNAITGVGDFEYGADGGTATGVGGGTPTGTGAGGNAGSGGGTGATGGSGPWYDEAFTRRRALSFAAPGEDLADFPVMVRLDAGRIDYGNVQAAGQDLRFVADDHTTVLSHEIEVFDSSDTSVVWVEVPLISAGTGPMRIWMYHGNAQAADGQDSAGTWDNGYAAVWHLHDDFVDSTGNGNNGTSSGTVNVEGQAGDGEFFDGVDSYLHVGSGSTIDDLFSGGGSLSAWTNPTTWGLSGFGRILDKSITSSAGNGWALQNHNSTLWTPRRCLRFERRFDGDLGVWETDTDSIHLLQGHHIFLTYDDGSPTNVPSIYINGAAQTLHPRLPAGVAEPDADSDLRIGNRGNDTSRPFHGLIDEVRLATVIRSEHWVAAQHLSLTDGLISYGAEQLVP